MIDSALQAGRIPENEGRDEQVHTAGAVALVRRGAVADCAEPVEEDGAAERILLLPLVEAAVATAPQVGILQPVERKESPFQLSQFAAREGQTVLPGIGRELAEDHRSGDRSLCDRQGEAQQVDPWVTEDADIEGARHQRSALGRHGHSR